LGYPSERKDFSGEGLRLSVTRVKLQSTEQGPGEECQKSQVNKDTLCQCGRNLVSTAESRLIP
jgi:hypothetical protein